MIQSRTTTQTAPQLSQTPMRANGRRQECIDLWLQFSRDYPSAAASEKCNAIALKLGMSSSGVRENLRRAGIDPTNQKVTIPV